MAFNESRKIFNRELPIACWMPSTKIEKKREYFGRESDFEIKFQ